MHAIFLLLYCPYIQAIKAVSQTDQIQTLAEQTFKDGNLVLAQDYYEKFFTVLDSHLVPPYQDYYKIQQNLWKIVWMRLGNKKIASKRVPVPAMESVMSLDSLD